jgi:hypothetical protein
LVKQGTEVNLFSSLEMVVPRLCKIIYTPKKTRDKKSFPAVYSAIITAMNTLFCSSVIIA